MILIAEDEDVKNFLKYGILPVPPVRTKEEIIAESIERAAEMKEAHKEALLKLRAEKGLQIRLEQNRKRKAEKVAPRALPHF
jgi:F0F1-type ATP synthase epsilon subunit